MEGKTNSYLGRLYYFHSGEWKALHSRRRSDRALPCDVCVKKGITYGLGERKLGLSCWFEASHYGHDLTEREGVRFCNAYHIAREPR